MCLSSAGLTSHRRSHAERPLANYEAFLGINQLTCEVCGKVCKSRSGLARHLKIHQAPGSGEHKGKVQPKDFVCCVCGRVCKSLLVSKVTAGLMTDDNNPKSAMVMLV